MNVFSILLKISTLSVVFLLLVGCGGKHGGQVTSDDPEAGPLGCVVVLPTQLHNMEKAKINGTLNDLQSGAIFLDDTIVKMLRESSVGKIVEADQLSPPLGEITGGITGVAKVVGERAQCEGVMMSTIIRFRQRQGGSFAADQSASSAFELRLVEASTGHRLWTVTFSETQESLFSNLFSFGKAMGRGFKWITVEELTFQGVEEKLEDCPFIN